MSFWDILGTLLIKPLQLLFEVVFVMANRVVGDPGLAIIALMVVPFSPAALSGVEWAITLAWVAVGFAILAFFGNKHGGKKTSPAQVR